MAKTLQNTDHVVYNFSVHTIALKISRFISLKVFGVAVDNT